MYVIYGQDDGLFHWYLWLSDKVTFGLSLAPGTFKKCMDAALSPQRQMGIGIFNYLNSWLILAQSEVELLSHRTLLHSHLEWHRSPRESISKDAGPHGHSIVSATAGPASYAAPPTLVETACPTPFMASRTPIYQGEPSLCNSLSPLEEPSLDGEGRGHGNDLQQEGCHNRCLQHRLGGAVRRQTGFRPLVESGKRLPHQLLGDVSSMSSLPVFPAGPNRAPCADPLGQLVRGVLNCVQYYLQYNSSSDWLSSYVTIARSCLLSSLILFPSLLLLSRDTAFMWDSVTREVSPRSASSFR